MCAKSLVQYSRIEAPRLLRRELDDVLSLINANDAALPQILALQQLKQTCMQDIVLSRPSFKNIVHQLQLLSN